MLAGRGASVVPRYSTIAVFSWGPTWCPVRGAGCVALVETGRRGLRRAARWSLRQPARCGTWPSVSRARQQLEVPSRAPGRRRGADCALAVRRPRRHRRGGRRGHDRLRREKARQCSQRERESIYWGARSSGRKAPAPPKRLPAGRRTCRARRGRRCPPQDGGCTPGDKACGGRRPVPRRAALLVLERPRGLGRGGPP